MKTPEWFSGNVAISILFTLYVIVPPIVLCFTVDDQKAKIYTTNIALNTSTLYTVYTYDWFFLLYAFGFIVFSLLVWSIFQLIKLTRPTWIFSQDKLNKQPDLKEPNWNSLLGILLFSYVFAFFIAVGARFSLQWYFIFLVIAYLVPYTYVCKTVDYKFKLVNIKTKSSVKDKEKDINSFLTVLCLCSFALMLSIYYVEIVGTTNMILVTKVSIAIGIVLIILALIYFSITRNYTIHIHHFIWSTMIVLITGLDSWFMCLTQSFAIAVHLHGLAVFGYDHIVYKNNPSKLEVIQEGDEKEIDNKI